MTIIDTINIKLLRRPDVSTGTPKGRKTSADWCPVNRRDAIMCDTFSAARIQNQKRNQHQYY